MAKNNSLKRLRLFNYFSENLKKICEEYNWVNTIELYKEHNYIYNCPLCDSFFDISSLDQNSKNPLTLEHIPPVSLNGKPLILTCKKCNNDGGSIEDKELKKFFSVEAFFKGESKIKGKFKLNDSNTFKADVKLLIDEKNFNVFLSKKSKYAFHQLEKISAEKSNFKLNSTIDLHNKEKADFAILKSAYLFAFSKLGYIYTQSLGGKYIQHALKENSKEINYIIKRNLSDLQKGVYYLRIDNHYEVLMSLLEIKVGNKKELVGVLLPGPTVESLDFFKKKFTKKEYRIESHLIPQCDIIKNPNHFLDFWQSISSL